MVTHASQETSLPLVNLKTDAIGAINTLPISIESRNGAELYKKSLAPIQELIRFALQAAIQSHKVARKLPLSAGQKKARVLNDLVASYGFRFKMPRTQTDAQGTLAYSKVGDRQPTGKREPIWVIKGMIKDKNTTRALGHDLSEVELVPAGPDHRRHRKA